jgi:four helix bundle protein
MITVRNYQDLIVWQKSLEFTIAIYRYTKTFPKEETYGLTSQMRRAAVSISSNIAEGQTRHTVKQFFQFLSIARGSLSELETQIILTYRLNYISEDTKNELLKTAEEIGRMLSSLMKNLTKPKHA